MGTKHGMGIKSVGGGTNVLVSLVLTSDDLESLCLGPENKRILNHNKVGHGAARHDTACSGLRNQNKNARVPKIKGGGGLEAEVTGF